MDKTELISSIQQIKDLAEKCLDGLGGFKPSRQIPKTSTDPGRTSKPPSIDFDVPMRPFVKMFSKGMSGAEKFTLILSHLAKGDLKREIDVKIIEKHWNKMKTLLGMDFNPCLTVRAKDGDFIESKKKGFYNLRPNWKRILKSFNA